MDICVNQPGATNLCRTQIAMFATDVPPHTGGLRANPAVAEFHHGRANVQAANARNCHAPSRRRALHESAWCATTSGGRRLNAQTGRSTSPRPMPPCATVSLAPRSGLLPRLPSRGSRGRRPESCSPPNCGCHGGRASTGVSETTAPPSRRSPGGACRAPSRQGAPSAPPSRRRVAAASRRSTGRMGRPQAAAVSAPSTPHPCRMCAHAHGAA